MSLHQALRDVANSSVAWANMTRNCPFAKLHNIQSPERRARNAEAMQGVLRTMSLHELRQARGKARAALAQDLHVGQPSIAKMEQHKDMVVSHRRRYIEALGGKLEITARFPDGEVRITNFGEVEEASEQFGQ